MVTLFEAIGVGQWFRYVGVDQATSMKVSGHKTDSMFRRYNIITAKETFAAMRKADAYLQTQPTTRNVLPMAVNDSTRRAPREEGQFGTNVR